MISSCPYPLKQRHDGNEDPYVLATRCFYYPPFYALPNRCASFPTVAIGLLAKRVWDRCLARIKKGSFESASPDPEAPSPPEPVQRRLPLLFLNSRSESSPQTIISSSSTTRFPQEVVDMIVAHLTHNTRSLLACSLTSRSWYIAAVPHLHCTLITSTSYDDCSKKTRWPGPLQAASEFGWLPFVTRLFITGNHQWGFSPEVFCSSTQCEFSALTNVRELSTRFLNIPSFIPGIQWYFGQLSQTLRSLTLKQPIGSDRQIVFFIGLFPHLEDLTLDPSRKSSLEKLGDRTLVPPFVPPLRGWLTASYLGGDGLAKAMIDLFGGVRFRHMNLDGMDGAQHLLYACADTLETFQLRPADLRGERFSSKGIQASTNDLTDRRSLRDYDFSRNKSLRELTISAWSLITTLRSCPPATVPSSLRAVLSTIKSPAFSEVVVVYWESNFYHSVYSRDAQAVLEGETAWYRRQFDTYREMYKGRGFRLVLRAMRVSDVSVRELKRAVAAETARGGLPPELSVTYTFGES